MGRRKTILNLENSVALVLLRLRRGFGVRTLSILFNVSTGTVSRCILLLLPKLEKYLAEKVPGLVPRDQLPNMIPSKIGNLFPGDWC